jgi:hypothetical protein
VGFELGLYIISYEHIILHWLGLYISWKIISFAMRRPWVQISPGPFRVHRSVWQITGLLIRESRVQFPLGPLEL